MKAKKLPRLYPRITKEVGFRILLILAAVLWLVLLATSWADNARASEKSAPRDSDEYNFNWLDPEKKIYVLQNRRYTKANRALLSVTAGPGFSNAYRTTWNVDSRLAYYASEAFGLEGFYTLTTNHPNSTFTALTQATSNITPLVREIHSQYGVLAQWVPWYAKINVFNNILYFDWYFSGGLGEVQTSLNLQQNPTLPANNLDQNFMGYFVGTGHQYHLGDTFTVRIDFTGAFYQAPIFGNSGENVWFTNYNFGVGVGLRL